MIDGDQGKNRCPYDHNRDYHCHFHVIYSEVDTIRRYVDSHSPVYGFDFHSPGHSGGRNDTVFIVRKPDSKMRFGRFAKILEKNIVSGSLRYFVRNDILPYVDWNIPTNRTFGEYIINANGFGFSLETPFFGEKDNVFSPEAAITLGKSVCGALREFMKMNCM